MIVAVRSVDTVTGEVETRRLSLDEILTRVAEVAGCLPAAIKGPKRYAVLVAARRDYCIRARAAGYSWTHLASHIGKDHTSCMYLVSGKKRKVAA